MRPPAEILAAFQTLQRASYLPIPLPDDISMAVEVLLWTLGFNLGSTGFPEALRQTEEALERYEMGTPKVRPIGGLDEAS